MLNKKINIIFIIFFLVFSHISCRKRIYTSSVYSYNFLPPVPKIRILLQEGKKKLVIKPCSSFSVRLFYDDSVIISSSSPQKFIVKVKDHHIYIGKHRLTSNKIKIISDDNFIYLNNKRYPGCIGIIYSLKNKLTAIDILDVEEYLYYVVGAEMPPTWKLEALKAQAIACRTYALYKIKLNRHKEYDLKATTDDQVYSPENHLYLKVKNAVDQTRGVVMLYNNDLFPAMFHACCGGYTESYEDVFGNRNTSLPLIGRRCYYCKDFSWKFSISRRRLYLLLKKKGYHIKRKYLLKVVKRSKTFRVQKIVILSGNKRFSISGHTFRMLIGPKKIKSTLFYIKITPTQFIFSGKGYGHGVGLCQYGAEGMAEEGYNYIQILKFYYTGIELAKVYK